MLGLTILLAVGIYLGLSALVVWQAVRWANRRNRRPWVWGGLAAFAMYNLVFWDWIPTVVMHKYYCATEAGFWVYKTPEQWVKENPGILEKLTAYNDGRSQELGPAHISYPLNPRISWQHKVAPVFLGIGNFEEILIDEKKGEVLAKEIYFRSGRCSGAPKGLAAFKFWVIRCKCKNEPFQANDGLSFSQYRDMVRGIPDKGETK